MHPKGMKDFIRREDWLNINEAKHRNEKVNDIYKLGFVKWNKY